MAAVLRSRVAMWAALAILLALGAVIVLVSPVDQVLGAAVRIVYVHVALSRSGGIGFMAAGLLGVSVLALPREKLVSWMLTIGTAALSLYAAGFVVSALAQAVSWGGISWQEPRVVAALNLLAVAVIVQVLGWLLPAERLRFRGALAVLLAVYFVWQTFNATNVLHPGNAISESPSAAIQMTGLLLVGVGVLLGAWLVWAFRVRQASARHDPVTLSD